ncbi:MAG: sugar phosphate nucleotidyltransferase [Chloroflexota bacterium]
MDKAYALIMAGGAGTRLWPLSRKRQPKPLLPLVERARSMFTISVDRLHPLFPPERILVVAGPALTEQLKEHAPDLPEENFIVEPEGRDTAPAVGLGAIHIRQRDPDAIMAVLTADHHITDEAMFRKVLDVACRMALEGNVVTLGIEPEFPSTGFGYIERGEKVRTVDGVDIHILRRFTEKPAHDVAESYLKTGKYSWNSGMFIWPVRRVMAEFERHAPGLYEPLEQIAGAIGQPDYQARLEAAWAGMKRISVDYALMEHVQGAALVIPTRMGWSDIGNFGALYDILSEQAGGDVVHSGCEPIVIDGSRTLVFSDRLVVTIGVEDLVIVDTDDVLLICRRDRAEDVKQVVNKLKEDKRNDYL